MPAILLHGHSIAKIRQKQAPIQIVGTQHCVQMIDTTKWLLYKYIGIKCRNDSTIKTYFSIQHQHRNKRCFPPTITHTPELAQQWPVGLACLGKKQNEKELKLTLLIMEKKVPMTTTILISTNLHLIFFFFLPSIYRKMN